MVQQIRDNSEAKQKRVNNFAVAAIWIQMVYSICVTGAWISDHTGVFVGKTGVMNFLMHLWEFFNLIGTSIAHFLNMIVIFLSTYMSIIASNIAVYGVLLILLVVGSILIIRKGIPKWKEKIEEIEIRYDNRGILGYKKAITLTLCLISFSWAILLAEYIKVNVVVSWLTLSLLTNIVYSLFFFGKDIRKLR